MAKDKLTDYDSTASGNLDVGGISVAEGMLPSGVNNAIRELMSHQADAFGAGTPLYVDQTNNRLGIGNAAPTTALTVDANGATVATFDRATSDGSIVDLQKSGTTVGSIGAYSSRMYIGTGDVGLQFLDAADNILPINPSTPANRDGAIDLGAGTVRFKDLYLSGGVYLGGTGSANYLDDYEEGTWNPSIGGTATYAASNYGRYTKIGNVVTLQFAIAVTSVGTGSTSSVINLPFTSGNIGEVQSGHVSYFGNLATATNFLSFYVGNNATSISFVGNTGNNTTIALNGFSVFGANTSIYGSITYRTA